MVSKKVPLCLVVCVCACLACFFAGYKLGRRSLLVAGDNDPELPDLSGRDRRAAEGDSRLAEQFAELLERQDGDREKERTAEGQLLRSWWRDNSRHDRLRSLGEERCLAMTVHDLTGERVNPRTLLPGDTLVTDEISVVGSYLYLSDDFNVEVVDSDGQTKFSCKAKSAFDPRDPEVHFYIEDDDWIRGAINVRVPYLVCGVVKEGKIPATAELFLNCGPLLEGLSHSHDVENARVYKCGDVVYVRLNNGVILELKHT